MSFRGGRGASLSIVVAAFAACANDPAPPPSAPVTVEVPPMPSASASAQLQTPPPNPERYAEEERVSISEPTEVPPLGTVPPGAFDRGKAAAAIMSAPLQRCVVPGGPTGPGHVTITWDPSGRVSSVRVDSGPYPGTAVGGCIAKVYSTLTVPPFSGSAVHVGKSFVLP